MEERLKDDLDVVAEYSIVNEFAAVRVRKVRSRAGERLELHSPRHDKTVRLDATVLEALARQPAEVLSQFIDADE
ncbi:hypothetical protein PSU4_58890 [Pseudonocardia sulfidoxydans NBRC 16205]|uniref:Dihydrodiol dehydrogenase n=1 Tax=Pseudonocardia sulfidoxydans NBRC 16205 TaxID=1223511 RepID=A0A511DQ30_9PSEU|nr:dihydrodiol dehydrogenase [Pseudonocardia sulfidoxydans]GEL26935.1 hypothetical protein PSU4_58890 [Pseudonocardia sulfidoxydans NBRC 16205]